MKMEIFFYGGKFRNLLYGFWTTFCAKIVIGLTHRKIRSNYYFFQRFEKNYMNIWK